MLGPRAVWGCLESVGRGSAVQVALGGLGRSITYCTQHTCQSVFLYAAAEVGASAVLLRGAAAPAEVGVLLPVR